MSQPPSEPFFKLVSIGVVLALGFAWTVQQPVPDWRQTLHWGVLAATGVAFLVAAPIAFETVSWPRIVGRSAIAAGLFMLFLAASSALIWGIDDCDVSVQATGQGEVEIERFCRWWNSSSGDCDKRRYPVHFGLFLGRPGDEFLPCG